LIFMNRSGRLEHRGFLDTSVGYGWKIDNFQSSGTHVIGIDELSRDRSGVPNDPTTPQTCFFQVYIAYSDREPIPPGPGVTPGATRLILREFGSNVASLTIPPRSTPTPARPPSGALQTPPGPGSQGGPSTQGSAAAPSPPGPVTVDIPTRLPPPVPPPREAGGGSAPAERPAATQPGPAREDCVQHSSDPAYWNAPDTR